MANRLDELDRKILEILQDDARISFTDVGRKLDVGETTIRYRVNRLKKEGVITHFTALLDPRKIGQNITAIVLLKVDHKNIKISSKKLALFREYHHLFQTTGEYDLVSVVHTRNLTHLNELRGRIKKLPGVKDVMVYVATHLIKVEPKSDLRL